MNNDELKNEAPLTPVSNIDEDAPRLDEEVDAPPRRRFLTGVMGAIGGTAVTAMGAYGLSNEAQKQEVKSRILQKIKQDIAQDQLEDALGYDKGTIGHDKYFTCN